MITKEQAKAAVKKHGSIRAAAKAAGIPYASFHDVLHKDERSPGQKAGRSLQEFKATHDKAYIVPARIKEALKQLGHGWEYEVQFAKIAGVSLADLGNFRDAFADHIVVVRRDGKRAWAGTPVSAARMRQMVS